MTTSSSVISVITDSDLDDTLVLLGLLHAPCTVISDMMPRDFHIEVLGCRLFCVVECVVEG